MATAILSIGYAMIQVRVDEVATMLYEMLCSMIDTVPVVPWLLIALFTILVFGIAGARCCTLYHGSVSKVVPLFSGTGLAALLAMYARFGADPVLIPRMIMTLIFLVASYSDYKTREVDDYLSVMLLLTGLIGMEISDIPVRLVSAIAICLFLDVAARFSRNADGDTLGGADIKIVTATTFSLGAVPAISGTMLGMTLGILGTLGNRAYQKRKCPDVEQEPGFALVPYLAAGLVIAMFCTKM